MNWNIKPGQLKYLVLGAGGIGMALRFFLYRFGMDDKGLLVRFYWSNVALWILTAAAAAAVVLRLAKVTGPADFKNAYHQSTTAAVGCVIAAALIVVYELRSSHTSYPEYVSLVLSIASAAALLQTAKCRIWGDKPHWLLSSLVCVYFTLLTVFQYRTWSSHPQMQDYVWVLAAHVGLLVSAYCHAAFTVGLGKHNALWIASMAAVYCSCVAYLQSEDKLLLLGSGIWVFTNLTSLEPRRRRKKPVLKLDEDAADAAS